MIRVGVFGAAGRMGATVCEAVVGADGMALVAAVDPHGAGGTVPGTDVPMPRDCSEATAREIDEEVKRMLGHARAQALEILVTHRADLDRIVNVLLERETLDRAAFEALACPSSNATNVASAPLRIVEPIALATPSP